MLKKLIEWWPFMLTSTYNHWRKQSEIWNTRVNDQHANLREFKNYHKPWRGYTNDRAIDLLRHHQWCQGGNCPECGWASPETAYGGQMDCGHAPSCEIFKAIERDERGEL